MNQRLYGVGVLGAVLAMLTLSAPTLAAAQQVPFKGRSSGVVTTVSVDPVAGIAYTPVTGTGHATHLGQFTETGDVAVDLTTGNARGTWTLTAANGDMLFLTMEAAPGIDSTHGSAAFTVVGGTGRFEGATGSYEQVITFATPPGPSDTTFTDMLTGTISVGRSS